MWFICYLFSVRYLRNEMENVENLPQPSPLIELKYILNVNEPLFVPNLDASSPNSIVALIESIIVDIYSMSDMITRVAIPDTNTESTDVLNDDDDTRDGSMQYRIDNKVPTYESNN